MIIEVSKDMIPFLVVMFILVIGFTNSFFIIALNIEADSSRFTTNNFFLAILWTWRNGVGDFQPDDFSSNNSQTLVTVIWLLCTFLILIVFLNLLIALLSNSFDKIQESLDKSLLKEMATMMAENEVFLNRKCAFRNIKYLIIIEKVLARNVDDEWNGRLDHINKYIVKSEEAHFKQMDETAKKLEDCFDLTTKFQIGYLEQNTEKSLNLISEKVDRLETFSKTYRECWQKALNKGN